jgi:hypothetical protein
LSEADKLNPIALGELVWDQSLVWLCSDAGADVKCVNVELPGRPTMFGEEEIMKSFLSTSAGVLGIAVFTFCGLQPAKAGCELITATHSARSKAKAAETSQALALQSAYDLQHARGWSHVTLSAHPVQGDPFWKAVRPNGVPPHARLEPDLVTAQFYTTCFTGVVVPYVCTTGSSVCGQ